VILRAEPPPEELNRREEEEVDEERGPLTLVQFFDELVVELAKRVLAGHFAFD